jgi:endonuclease G
VSSSLRLGRNPGIVRLKALSIALLVSLILTTLPLPGISFVSTATAAPADPVPSVVVNKYFNSGTTADIVELLVVQNNLDMRGMILKDFSSSMANDGGGKFQFSNDALWSSLPAGTLIVLRNNNSAADVTVGSGDYNLDLGLQNGTYFTTLASGFDIAGTEMVMIKAAGSDPLGVTGSIHALAGGTAGAQFNNAPAPKLRSTGQSGTNQFVYANNSTRSIADFSGTDATGAATGLTFGAGNNANNTAYINSLRGGTANNPPSIATPSNPIATVNQDAAPFNVSLSGSDDGAVYSWSATAGAGVSNVSVSAGQGTANVTYSVTLQAGYSGTASFTATLSDTVNAPVSKTVNIQVTPTVVNNPPSISAPANPAATVAQDAAPFTVTLNGSDDGAVYNWSATPGTGVSAVTVSAGQGTPGAIFNVTLEAGYNGMASFTASLSDNFNAAVTQGVNIAVTATPPPPVDHVVISQVYGAGGNAGATYRNDYVELFNPTTGPVDLGGWTIQYGSATGDTWQVQPLGGIMQPGEYYLISLGTGGAVGALLPAPNVSGSINLSGTAGKVALSNGGDPLSGCAIGDPTLVDMIGYGATANCREGAVNATGPTSAQASTTAMFRKNDGYKDTNSNSADFQLGSPNPRRTTPITEIGPYVLNVDPRSNASSAPRDANLTITFTEAVNIDTTENWFNINCAGTGAHNDATVASANNGGTWIIIPNQNFQAGEQCTATIFKSFVHDVDTDDPAPDSDTLKADYTWSFKVATGTAPPYGPEVNLAMGNPSGAVADLNQPNNYLMVKPEFTLSYNRDRGTPNWVSWHLSDEWVGSLTRVDTFRADPMVPSDWYRVLATDYFNSGFDRGHMTPNADRDKETSAPINQATFLMSNMVPQAPDNNQGPWANMENYLRTLLPGNELYIVSGPAGAGGTGSSGFMTTIAGGKITVPAYTWKVVLVLPKQDGSDVERVTAGARTIAVIMPNTQGIRSTDWTTYIKSVDEVEALTGYDFFSEVPDAVENAIEAGVNGVNPPGTASMYLTVQEDSPASFTLDAVSPNNNPLNYTILSGPAHGTLTGTGAQRGYTPAANFSGTDSFTFRVNDGQTNSNVSTVTINVTPVNDLPEVSGVPASATIDEGQAYSFTGSATDVDTPAGSLSFSLEGAPEGAVINPGTGVFNWTPSETQGGASYSFSVRVSDGTGYTDAPVTINVNEVNQAPTLTAIDSKTVELGNTLSFQAAGSDADVPAQTLTYSLTGAVPSGASIDGSTGVFSWTPAASQAGAIYSFNVRVTDSGSPNLYTEQPVQVAVAYTWTGALSPIRADGNSVFKLGSTVPVKFRLTGASAGISTAVARVYIAKLTNNVAGTETEAVATGNSSTGNLFRYDGEGQYIFNLNTKGMTPGTYQLRIDTGDGVIRIITFGLN